MVAVWAPKRGSALAAVVLAVAAAGPSLAGAEPPASETAEDPRQLLPIPFETRQKMLKNMRQENLGNLGDMLEALARDDLEAVARIADSMAYTPAKQRASRRRGSREFAAMAARFHGERMPAIRRAAEMGKRRKVLKRMGEAVRSCNNCHASFRLVEWPADRAYAMPEPVSLPGSLGSETP